MELARTVRQDPITDLEAAGRTCFFTVLPRGGSGFVGFVTRSYNSPAKAGHYVLQSDRFDALAGDMRPWPGDQRPWTIDHIERRRARGLDFESAENSVPQSGSY